MRLYGSLSRSTQWHIQDQGVSQANLHKISFSMCRERQNFGNVAFLISCDGSKINSNQSKSKCSYLMYIKNLYRKLKLLVTKFTRTRCPPSFNVSLLYSHNQIYFSFLLDHDNLYEHLAFYGTLETDRIGITSLKQVIEFESRIYSPWRY